MRVELDGERLSSPPVLCDRGDVASVGFEVVLPGATVPRRHRVSAAVRGAEPNAWDLWAVPAPSLADEVLRASRVLDAPLIDADSIMLAVERGYSKGFGLAAPSAPFSPPNAREACPELEVTSPGAAIPASVRTVVTHRLTPACVDHLVRGGRVVALASNGPGGIGSVAEWHFGSVPLVLERGPLAEGDSEWVVDLLLVDLIERWCRAVPSKRLGIAERVEPIVRQVFTHDQARPVMLDLLCAARVGEGVLVISSLDHRSPAGRYLMARVLGWVGREEVECAGELDTALVRSWAVEG